MFLEELTFDPSERSMIIQWRAIRLSRPVVMTDQRFQWYRIFSIILSYARRDIKERK